MIKGLTGFFYITSGSACIKLRCVTPLYCNNSIQHENLKHTITQSISQNLVSLCFWGSKSSTMLKQERLESWFEFETKDAIKFLSTSVATQGTMPQKLKLETK